MTMKYLMIFMYLMGLMLFCLNQKHLLIMLLSLEFIVLIMFMFLYLFLLMFNYELYFSMVFLTFSVCEGALGLSILVNIIRSHGNDFFNSFNILC